MNTPATRGFVNQVLLYTLFGIGLSGSIGVGAVWTREQISREANANKALSVRIADVARRCEEASAAIAAEQDPAALLQRNTAWGLGLVSPSETRVQHVAVDPMARLATAHSLGEINDRSRTISFNVVLQH